MSPAKRSRALRSFAVALLALTAVVLLPAVALAHPLGNATVNHYDGLHVFPDRITDTAVEDIAEIPTYQRRHAFDHGANNGQGPAEQAAYARSQCASLASALSLQVDSKTVKMVVTRSAFQQRPGAIGLPASRLECDLTGTVDVSRPATLTFADNWDSEGIGWHEVTAVGTGVTLQHSPFPAVSISHALRAYPNDLLSSPLDLRGGTVKLERGSSPSSYAPTMRLTQAGPLGHALNRLTSAFNHLVGARHVTLSVGLLALLLSVALGAGHALLPGHGKTIMAAYLVGRRGRLRDVITVGATVTLTHTAGVLLLGLAITTTAAFAPTQAERYLGATSGLIIASVGIGLLVSAVRRARPRDREGGQAHVEALTVVAERPVSDEHALTTTAARRQGQVAGGAPHPDPQGQHGHDDWQPHSHRRGGDHHHGSNHGHEHHLPPTTGTGFSKTGLVGLGVAGGLVPSPSALLVLLAAIALGRTFFGVLLVLGYGLGMAGSLSAAGLLLVKFRVRVDRYLDGTRPYWANGLLAVLPVVTALLVLAVGIGLTLRAVGGQV